MTKDPETVSYSASKPAGRQVSINIFWLLPLAAIVLCALSFWAGTAYQKGHTRSASVAAANNGLAGGRFGGSGRFAGQRPNIGDVTAVSSTSITIQDNFDNSTKTFSITGSTTVTNNGASASVSDIQTGDRVVVRTSGSGSTQATAIDINPSFGGGQQGSATQGSATAN